MYYGRGVFRIQQSHGETWLTKRNYKPQGKKGSCNDLSESFCGHEVRRQRKEVEKFWKDNDIFQKSIDNRKEGPTYTFYDGPPTANGKPHIGHVLTRVIKDMIPRYRTMKGYMVPRKAGWDTHGLPVELEVRRC